MNLSLDFIVRVYDLKTLEPFVGQLSYRTNVRWSCDSLYLFDHKGPFIESYVSLSDMHSQVRLASLAGFFNHFLLFGEMVVVRVVHCTVQAKNKTELFQFI